MVVSIYCERRSFVNIWIENNNSLVTTLNRLSVMQWCDVGFIVNVYMIDCEMSIHTVAPNYVYVGGSVKNKWSFLLEMFPDFDGLYNYMEITNICVYWKQFSKYPRGKTTHVGKNSSEIKWQIDSVIFPSKKHHRKNLPIPNLQGNLPWQDTLLLPSNKHDRKLLIHICAWHSDPHSCSLGT